MQVKKHQGKSLQYLTIEPDGYDSNKVYPVVFLLHGFGAHMGDLAHLCPTIESREYLFVCPNAPLALEIAPGMSGFAWTPIGNQLSKSDIEHADDALGILVQEMAEQYHMKPGTAILGGFSQGGMMTYHYGLRNHKFFCGLAVLSAKILYPDSLRKQLPHERSQAIFIAHGTEDTIIPIDFARDSRSFLESEGYKPYYKEYDMSHEIDSETINDLSAWMHQVLPCAPI